jgi:hypothetical protein
MLIKTNLSEFNLLVIECDVVNMFEWNRYIIYSTSVCCIGFVNHWLIPLVHCIVIVWKRLLINKPISIQFNSFNVTEFYSTWNLDWPFSI